MNHTFKTPKHQHNPNSRAVHRGPTTFAGVHGCRSKLRIALLREVGHALRAVAPVGAEVSTMAVALIIVTMHNLY